MTKSRKTLLSVGLLAALCALQQGCFTAMVWPRSSIKHTKLDLEAEAPQIFKAHTEYDQYLQTFLIPFRLEEPEKLRKGGWHLFDREAGYLAIQAEPERAALFVEYLERLLKESDYRGSGAPFRVRVRYSCRKESSSIRAGLVIDRGDRDVYKCLYPDGNGEALWGPFRILEDSVSMHMYPLLPESHPPIRLAIIETAAIESHEDLIWQIPLTPLAVAADVAMSPLYVAGAVIFIMSPGSFMH